MIRDEWRPIVPGPIIRPCPTPGHAHPQYLEHRRPDSRYRVTAYASHEDREADRPRARLYCRTRGEAENHRADTDCPIVSVESLER